MTNAIKGDLIALAEEGRFDAIVHQANCFHTMGSGIARSLVQKYPSCVSADKETPYGSRHKMGSYSYAPVKSKIGDHYFLIINAYSQFGYGRDSRRTDYGALRSVFRAIARNYPNYRVGYPALGCGLAGGDWEVVRGIIDTELIGMNHSFVHL